MNTPKLIALAATAAAILIAAPAANAEPTTAHDMGGDPCSEVTLTGTIVSGGCSIEADSTAPDHILYEAYENGQSVGYYWNEGCEWSYDIHVGPDAEGWIDNISISGGYIGCANLGECKDNGNDVPWPAKFIRDAQDDIRLQIDDLCTVVSSSPETERHGTLDMPVQLDATEGIFPESATADQEVGQVGPGSGWGIEGEFILQGETTIGYEG